MVCPGPVIWINGWPGVGKLTIAETLVMLLGVERAILVDFKTMDFSGPADQSTDDMRRANAFTQFVENPKQMSKAVVFVDFCTVSWDNSSVAEEYREAAQRSGRRFVPVYLTCEISENLKRVKSLERKSSLRGKLMDPTTINEVRKAETLFEFPDIQGLEIDVTCLEAHEAASLIRAYLDGKSRPSPKRPAKIVGLASKPPQTPVKKPKSPRR